MLHGSGARRIASAQTQTPASTQTQAPSEDGNQGARNNNLRSGAGQAKGRGAARSRIAILQGAATAAAVALTLATGCKKEKKPEPISVPPPQGAANVDELSTAIGQARGLSSSLAPTSVQWTRTFVLDDKRAILAGEIDNEAIALLTDNAGRTWKAFRAAREGWSTWSVNASGATVLTMGPRTPPQPSRDPNQDAGPPGLSESLRLLFGAFDAQELSAPSPVTLPKITRGAQHPLDVIPAVLSPDAAAMVLEDAPRRSVLVYGGLPGAEPAPPVKLPPLERVLPIPYGRPPVLLSVRGRDLMTRPIPEPGKPLDAPQKVTGLIMTPTSITELSTTPACEVGAWSFQLVTQPPAKTIVVGVSATKTVAFPVPAKIAKGAKLGCGADQITVEVELPKSGDPRAAKQAPETTLAVCALDGTCTLPEKPPFRPWLEPHEQSIASVPTRQGVVAALTSRAAARYGLYLVQSLDAGKVYEVPRVVGEGLGDRGRIDIGALMSFGERVVVLLQADVTGTSRRGWYVAASEDGGLTWNPP